MVNSRTDLLDEIFFALSDPTRRALIARLAEGEASVAELSEPFAISPPAISKHLRVLERAGLLQQTRCGRQRQCVLQAEPLREASEFVARYRKFWTHQLDNLQQYLEEPQTKETEP